LPRARLQRLVAPDPQTAVSSWGRSTHYVEAVRARHAAAAANTPIALAVVGSAGLAAGRTQPGSMQTTSGLAQEDAGRPGEGTGAARRAG
jgi:hypothetical protein